MHKNWSISRFTKQEVDALFARAQRCSRTGGMDILLAPASKNGGRILVVTSSKVGSAPERNLIRRRLKALFYELELPAKKLDCIIIVKKEGVRNSFADLHKLLIQAFSNYDLKNS